MRMALRVPMQQLGTALGNLQHFVVSDADLDTFTRVAPSSSETDREHVRKTVLFLRRLADSLERSLSRSKD